MKPDTQKTKEQREDLERLVNGDPEALDEEYGFNNDELLRLGIGYGIPGALSVEQVQREAAELLGLKHRETVYELLKEREDG